MMLGYPSAGTKTANDQCNIVDSEMSEIMIIKDSAIVISLDVWLL